jgi:hypothetical protein
MLRPLGLRSGRSVPSEADAMPTVSPNRLVLLLAGLLLLTGGCGSGSKTLTPVHGKVTYRGAPVEAGTIVFTPDTLRGTRGTLAFGAIEPDGSYSLRTEDGSGAAPGWHRVTIVAVQAPSQVPPGQRFARPVSLLPHKYRDPDLSGLACEVKAGQVNALDFHLE